MAVVEFDNYDSLCRLGVLSKKKKKKSLDWCHILLREETPLLETVPTLSFEHLYTGRVQARVCF